MKPKIVFLSKIVLFAVVLFLLVFQLVMPQYTALYNAAVIDKYDRAKGIGQPKIILVGDSNVAFGFDSGLLEEAFGMPVVNFGLHGNLGQVFVTELIRDCIGEGDIVILAPAGYHYSIDRLDYVMAWVTIENHYRLWSGIPSGSYEDMLLAFPTYLKRAIGLFVANEGNKYDESPWGRIMFDEYGDYSYPRPECVIAGDDYSQNFAPEPLDEQASVYWNDYNEFVLSKNASLFISAPPILSVALEDDLEPLQKQLDEQLAFPMISQLSDYVFPLEFFYDTGFHLNDYGRVERTQQLISDLSAVLG